MKEAKLASRLDELQQLIGVRDALEAELYRRNYHAFIKAAWPTIEPGVTFVDGLPVEMVAEYVQLLIDDKLGKRNLLINIPPRCMKSITVSVCLAPWVWAKPERAHLKFLYSSYSALLSTRDSLKARRLIQSPWYQRFYGNVFTFTGDQNLKTRFDNDKNGSRIATSVNATTTGEGGDIIICDDPHNALEAESDAVRETTLTWWREAMSTRGNDPKTVKRIVVMQRLHERDLAGHLLAEERDDYEHVILPMRYEPRIYVRGSRFKDPRTKAGELLWPQRFPELEVKRLERNLGEYGAAGQLQQRPAPRGGGILKMAKHVKLWPSGIALPDLLFVVQSYDTAYTKDTANDPTACTVWGVFDYKGVRNALLLDAWSEHMDYPALRRKAIADWGATYGGIDGDDLHPPRRADTTLVEEKGSGKSLVQDLNLARVPAVTYNPGRADKTARANIVAPILETGHVWVIESKKESGKAVTWARAFLHECSVFPSGAHDDYVDTFTQCMIYLRDSGWITLQAVPEDEIVEVDYEAQRQRRRNPYDV